MQELWLPTRERDDYFVSNLGNVRGPRRLLKPQPLSKTGYSWVKLGRGNTRTVHRIVAEAWVPNPDNLPQVNHIDGNKANNAASNLEWITALANRHHAMSMGLQRCKHSADQIREIRRRLAAGETCKTLAAEFNTDISGIAKIRYRKTYAWVD